MDGKTLGDIFQEILAELSEMEPTSLDELEKKIKDILRRLGECIMEWKLEDWDVDLRKEICWECGAKLENRKRERQIAMSVSDVNFQRYRSSCPGCGKIEYPHHLCEKVKQRLSPVFEDKERRWEAQKTVLEFLNSDDVDGALEHIQKLLLRFRKKSKLYHLKKLAGYIQRNREGIWYKEAREKGISIGAGSADKAGDILICRRMKLRGMRWSRVGADGILNIRILVYNREWESSGGSIELHKPFPGRKFYAWMLRFQSGTGGTGAIDKMLDNQLNGFHLGQSSLFPSQ
jgi:ribosomal protein L32